MDTSNILFISGGAFVGLDKIVKNRLKKNTIGFESDKKEKISHKIIFLKIFRQKI